MAPPADYYRQWDEFYLQKIQDPDKQVHGGTRPLLTSPSLWKWICGEKRGYPQDDDDESANSYHWRGFLEVEQHGAARDGDNTNELFFSEGGRNLTYQMTSTVSVKS